MFENSEELKKRIKDEEFFGFVDYVSKNIDKTTWKGYSDQERRVFIEEYYGDNK